MGAAAKLDRIGPVALLAHGDDTYFIAIFFAEQSERAVLHRLVRRHQARRQAGIFANADIDFGLDRALLRIAHRLGVADIETQALGCDERALLGDMIAEMPTQRRVQQMGRRVVGAELGAARRIDGEGQRVAAMQGAALDLAHMHDQIAGALLRVRDDEARAVGGGDLAAIAHLAAGFAIEGSLVGDQGDFRAGFGLGDLGAVLHQGEDNALGALQLIAEEFAGADTLANFEPDAVRCRVAGAGPGLARLGALTLHGGLEARRIDVASLAAERVLGEIEREAIGVVELEGDLAGQRFTLTKFGGGIAQELEAARQGLLEAGFLQFEGFADQRLGAYQLREGLAHLADQGRHQAVHQRLFAAHLMGVTHGAAHDAAQHIAAAFVGRRHPVGDEERARP